MDKNQPTAMLYYGLSLYHRGRVRVKFVFMKYNLYCVLLVFFKTCQSRMLHRIFYNSKLFINKCVKSETNTVAIVYFFNNLIGALCYQFARIYHLFIFYLVN